MAWHGPPPRCPPAHLCPQPHGGAGIRCGRSAGRWETAAKMGGAKKQPVSMETWGGPVRRRCAGMGTVPRVPLSPPSWDTAPVPLWGGCDGGGLPSPCAVSPSGCAGTPCIPAQLWGRMRPHGASGSHCLPSAPGHLCASVSPPATEQGRHHCQLAPGQGRSRSTGNPAHTGQCRAPKHRKCRTCTGTCTKTCTRICTRMYTGTNTGTYSKTCTRYCTGTCTATCTGTCTGTHTEPFPAQRMHSAPCPPPHSPAGPPSSPAETQQTHLPCHCCAERPRCGCRTNTAPG